MMDFGLAMITPSSVLQQALDNGRSSGYRISVYSLDCRPQGRRKGGLVCMRMCVHYPKKGVIRVFVVTVSKINAYTINFLF